MDLKNMPPKFIKVRKANKSRDRGFIAVDSICSVFEDKERHIVSIMTMDGFWYDVDDDVDALYALITGDDRKNGYESKESSSSPKKDYYRRKKMMLPLVAEEKAAVNHEDISKNMGDEHLAHKVDEEDIFRPVMRKGKSVKPYSPKSRINSDLSAGADEGHYNINPKGTKLPLGEGL